MYKSIRFWPLEVNYEFERERYNNDRLCGPASTELQKFYLEVQNVILKLICDDSDVFLENY